LEGFETQTSDGQLPQPNPNPNPAYQCRSAFETQIMRYTKPSTKLTIRRLFCSQLLPMREETSGLHTWQIQKRSFASILPTDKAICPLSTLSTTKPKPSVLLAKMSSLRGPAPWADLISANQVHHTQLPLQRALQPSSLIGHDGNCRNLKLRTSRSSIVARALMLFSN
jgi:hypothetical protein